MQAGFHGLVDYCPVHKSHNSQLITHNSFVKSYKFQVPSYKINMRKIIYILIPLITITILLSSAGFVLAQACNSGADCKDGQVCNDSICKDSCPPSKNSFCDPNNPLDEDQKCVIDQKTGTKSCYACVNYTCIQLEQPLPEVEGTTITSFETYLNYVYQIALGIVGLAALIFIIIGGAMYVTAAGNVAQMTEAKNRIQSALLGLILALAAYLILYTINPDLVRLSKTQIEYPVLPKVVLSCENNTCVARTIKLKDVTADTVNTCGEVGTVCPPRCKLAGAYWSKRKAKIGDTVKLIIQAKGACDDVPLQAPNIYVGVVEKDIKVEENIFTSKFKKGWPYYTATADWVVKKPSPTILELFEIAKKTVSIGGSLVTDDKLKYIAEFSIIDRNINGELQYYFDDSTVLKVDTGKSTTTGEGGEEVAEGMVIVGDCVGRISWDRKVAYRGDTVKWNFVLNNCEGKNYKVFKTDYKRNTVLGKLGSWVFGGTETIYDQTAAQPNKDKDVPYTIPDKSGGRIFLELEVDGKKSNPVGITITIPEYPTID